MLSSLLCLLPLLSQGQHVQYRRYTMEDGLSSNETYSLCQDDDGFIWVGTDAGVARFDGQHWDQLTMVDGLTDNDIILVRKDSASRVWFLTYNGKPCFLKNKKLYNPDNDPGLKAITAGTPLICFMADSKGNAWIASDREGVMKYGEEGVARYGPQEGYSLKSAADMAEMPDGRVQLPIRENIPEKVPEVFSLWSIMTVDDYKLQSYCVSLAYNEAILNSNNSLWYCMGDTSVKIYQAETKYLYLNKLCKDKDKNLWALEAGKGVLFFERTANGYKPPKRFLEQFNLSEVLQDREGNYWISTLGSGVLFLKSLDFLAYTQSQSLPDPKVQALESADGKVYLGTQEGMHILDQGEISPPVPWPLGLSYSRLIGSGTSPDGSIYFAGRVNIQRYRPETGLNLVFSCLPKHRANRRGNHLKGISLDHEGTLWMATFHYVAYWNDQEGLVKVLKSDPDFRAYSVYHDTHERLWVGTYRGLYLYDLQSKELHFMGDSIPTLRYRVTVIRENKDGDVFFGTTGHGLAIYRNGSFRIVGPEDGLNNPFVDDIHIDAENRIWLATKRGLFELRNWPDGKLTTFRYENLAGTISNDLFTITSNGDQILTGTSLGLSMFKYGSIPKIPPPPVLSIQSVEINGADSVVKSSYALKYDQGRIRIRFKGILFRHSDQLRYRYRLVSDDSTWQETDNPEVELASLAPGSYKFEVQAYLNDEQQYSEIQSLSFYIRPLFSQTTAFVLLLFGLGLLIVGGIAYGVVKANKRREGLQRKLVESKQIAMRSQMNPHFIFNSLNSIQQYIATNERRTAYSFLSRFGKLMRMILENSNKALISIQEEVDSLNIYLDLECMRTDNHFEYSFSLDPELDTEYHKIPPMLLQPFVENAIWHGVVHRETPGLIGISFDLEGDTIRVSIRDNGKGRAYSEAVNARKMLNHKSQGIKITRERLNLINQKRKNPISLQIQDLTDESGNGTGTLVLLFIPVQF